MIHQIGYPKRNAPYGKAANAREREGIAIIMSIIPLTMAITQAHFPRVDTQDACFHSSGSLTSLISSLIFLTSNLSILN